MSVHLVTGGAGFIGCNLAASLLSRGEAVIILDDLSRRGAAQNLEWLRTKGDFIFTKTDIRNADALDRLFRDYRDIKTVSHLAGQVAVTRSVEQPRLDFEVNALGALNLLEAIRKSGQRPLLMYASTNKVYGGMEQVEIDELETRYAYRNLPGGVAETQALDFHSPYGCSKGAADQYIHDYARIYGLPTVVFRQSCIYGPRQLGLEDQGWVAWFIIAAALNRPITIYGNGKQVRDLLYIGDLVEAFHAAAAAPEDSRGKIYNVGGGPENTVSVWAEFGPMLESLFGRKIPVTYSGWRPGDQPVYISNIDRIRDELGWQPRTSVREGIETLFHWVQANQAMFKHL